MMAAVRNPRISWSRIKFYFLSISMNEILEKVLTDESVRTVDGLEITVAAADEFLTWSG